jgi:serpin B
MMEGPLRWNRDMKKLLPILLVVTLAGCFEASPPPTTDPIAGGSRVDDGLGFTAVGDAPRASPRQPLGPPSPDEHQTALGQSRFAWELYRALRAEETGNLFVSPYSVSSALAMTYGGAYGETAEEMARVLHFDLPGDRLHPAFGQLARSFRADRGAQGYQLHVANRLWGQDQEGYLDAFLALTRDQYGAELARVDFANDSEGARKLINLWAAEQTEGKIQDLIPPGLVSELTRFVLTNAIYFKGDWEKRFNEGLTQEAPFHVSPEEDVNVPLMMQTGDFKYAQFEGFAAIELPYVGGELAMLVILPDAVDGLAALEVQLSVEKLVQWTNELRSTEIDLFFPKFEMTTTYDHMERTLRSLGMEMAMTPGQADFSGIHSSSQLSIAAVVHKAYLKVDEKGTEAAAATAVVENLPSPIPPPKPVFRADHPFVFVIRDYRTQSVLFAGSLVRP